MEKNIELTLIYEAYKSLLTENMRSIFEMYYNMDLSLREIGEEKHISYQAVNDTLKKVEKLLKEYESKLHIARMKKLIVDINNNLDNDNLDEAKKLIKVIGEM